MKICILPESCSGKLEGDKMDVWIPYSINVWLALNKRPPQKNKQKGLRKKVRVLSNLSRGMEEHALAHSNEKL